MVRLHADRDFTTGVTNASSEGVNRLIKTDARCAFGYRNPADQRLRARCGTTRRARGHLTTHTGGRTADHETLRPLMLRSRSMSLALRRLENQMRGAADGCVICP
ncbi:transposase [Actinospica durhamensis]|uniref:Transposase n=1 Tax=Actinospica durhamensis TaxID=1508375 RepID=A0A941EI64_9ACTN|nr:transposase [Actinospica durhamensis]MBR7831932.1 transposase [Actinospica durhamensis]